MKRWAALLIVMGLGSFVLPLIGMQFRLLGFLAPDAQAVVGLAMAALGGVLMFGDSIRERWAQRGAGRAAGATAPPAGAPTPAAEPSTASPSMTAPSTTATRGEFCPHCGQRLGPQGGFCGHCGEALPDAVISTARAADVPPARETARDKTRARAREAERETAGKGPREDRARLNRIADGYQRGELVPCREKLRAYLDDHPQDPTAWSILCNTEEALGRPAQAEQAARQAIAVDPHCVSARNNLGRLLRERRDYAGASASYQQALVADPDNAHAYSGLSVVEVSQGHNARALELARRAYELDTQDPVVASNLAIAYHCNGLVGDRERLKEVARRLGYANLAGLERIFRGEVPVVDTPQRGQARGKP